MSKGSNPSSIFHILIQTKYTANAATLTGESRLDREVEGFSTCEEEKYEVGVREAEKRRMRKRELFVEYPSRKVPGTGLWSWRVAVFHLDFHPTAWCKRSERNARLKARRQRLGSFRSTCGQCLAFPSGPDIWEQ